MARQKAPTENPQGAAQSGLHRGLAPCAGGLLHRPSRTEGLPPPHRAQQEGRGLPSPASLLLFRSVFVLGLTRSGAPPLCFVLLGVGWGAPRRMAGRRPLRPVEEPKIWTLEKERDKNCESVFGSRTGSSRQSAAEGHSWVLSPQCTLSPATNSHQGLACWPLDLPHWLRGAHRRRQSGEEQCSHQLRHHGEDHHAPGKGGSEGHWRMSPRERVGVAVEKAVA